jgi:HSP20 family protein
MSLGPWKPFEEMEPVRREMRKYLENPYYPYAIPPLGEGMEWGPKVDLRETEAELILSAELPGIDPENLDISLSEKRLVLRGQSERGQEMKEEGYRLMERRYGAFQRSIDLPAEIKPANARADYHDGILEVTMPKSDEHKNRSVKLKINRKEH